MAPGQLCNDLLHDFLGGKGLSERTHVFEVSRRKDPSSKVRREAIDHPGTPALLRLARKNLAADIPVEKDQLSINGNGCPDRFQRARPKRVNCVSSLSGTLK
jgi:hypothetical protein